MDDASAGAALVTLSLVTLLHLGVATVPLAWAMPAGVATLPLLHLGVATVPLAWADARTLRLPNALTVPGLVVTTAVVIVVGDELAGATLVGVLAVTAVGWRAGWLGLGDVKLLGWMAGASALTGTLDPTRLAAAAVAASALVLAALAGARAGVRAGAGAGARRATGSEHVTVRIPFGPALLAGFWFGVLLPVAR